MNGSVQFVGLSQIWGSELLYIINIWAQVEATGWGSSSNGNPGSSTPGSRTVTGSWGGRFTHSNANLSVNWYGYINASPSDSLRSPAIQRIAQYCVRECFIHHRCQQSLWRQSNRQIFWQRQDRDFSDGTATQ